MADTNIYRDIALRTDGDIYIGVVGPVRTGKSTFIKRFMDLLVIPWIENEYERERLIDELPQSGSGKTVMTTQPKFVPNEAVEIEIDDNTTANIRLVDCVGYMVDGALGSQEDDKPRMVRTPWYDYDIPFEDAAEIGTHKVITDHSTIGIVITTDGSITGIERENYIEAEQRVISELKAQGKPFIVILNTTLPTGESAVSLAESLEEKYSCPVMPLDVIHMTDNDLSDIMEKALMEFPIQMVRLDIPEWMQSLNESHYLIKRLMDISNGIGDDITHMSDYKKILELFNSVEDFEENPDINVNLGNGVITISLVPLANMFYRVLSEECGFEISDDYHLISMLKDFSKAKKEYDKLHDALSSAYIRGYGQVPPMMEEMQLSDPEVIPQGSRYGVKLEAKASALHLIRIDIDSAVTPTVGTEQQAEEFAKYLTDTFKNNPDDMWNTSIFGRPLYDLVADTMREKVNRLPEDVQSKLQETIGRMVNDGCKGLVCVLL